MNKSTFRIISLILIGFLLFHCQKSTETKIVTINILNDSLSTVEGDTILVKNLAAKLETFDQKIFLKISSQDSSLKMGVMHEVQRQISKTKNSYTYDESKEELIKSLSN